MARIDDVIFVDDATKKCVASESLSIFNRGGLGGRPIQKRMSPSPFSIQHSPFSSPFATPTFCSSPQNLSTGGPPTPINSEVTQSRKLDIPVSADLDRPWTYAAGKVPANAPERD